MIPLLKARGLTVVSVQNPLSSLGEDVAATNRTINPQKGPVILVGHSWDGVVTTQAGNNRLVSSPVYMSAFAPDTGESITDIIANLPPPAWVLADMQDESGYQRLPLSSIERYFAEDLPHAKQRVLAATQEPWFGGELADRLTLASWHRKPSRWVLPLDDRIIDPELQLSMATRAKARMTRVDTRHVAMLADPEAIASPDGPAVGVELSRSGESVFTGTMM